MPGLPPFGHMTFKQCHIPVSEGSKQTLDNSGSRTKFAGHHQFSILVQRDLRQPQQDFPGRCMDCAGDVPIPELEDGTDIDNGWRVF